MPKLTRSISLSTLSLYGLGNILGAGIYVLIGVVSAESGDGLFWSFVIAAIVASFTALSYGALSGTYPKSAGAAVYTQKAFGSKLFSTIIGLALALTAIVSSSALLRGFDRYFQQLLIDVGLLSERIPAILIMLPMLALLASIAYKGIKDSTRTAVLFTVLEASGLLIIIIVAGIYGDFSQSVTTSLTALTDVSPLSIALGAFLAFYAFVGFEDIVNVAEEVKNPKKTIKRGMMIAVITATIFYGLVVLASLAVLSSGELSTSNAPLATVFQTATGSTLPLITIIGTIAITNGILIQIITSSRILYGLAREKWIPSKIATISPTRHTPTIATTIAVSGIAIGSSLLPLGTLAEITSFILLIIFTAVHASAFKLLKTKQLKDLHLIVPILGIISNLAVIALQISSWL